MKPVDLKPPDLRNRVFGCLHPCREHVCGAFRHRLLPSRYIPRRSMGLEDVPQQDPPNPQAVSRQIWQSMSVWHLGYAWCFPVKVREGAITGCARSYQVIPGCYSSDLVRNKKSKRKHTRGSNPPISRSSYATCLSNLADFDKW